MAKRKTKKSKEKSNQGLRSLLTYISIILLVLALGGYYSFQSLVTTSSINEITNESGTVDLTLTPAELIIYPNTKHDLILNIDTNDSPVATVTAELEYDPTKLTVNSITKGKFLSDTIRAAEINDGKIIFSYSTPPDSTGIVGSGDIATISITSLASDTTLSFSVETIATSTESATTNILRSASGAKILITYPTTSLSKLADPTCTNIALGWEKVDNAPGYLLDISKNSDFTELVASTRLNSDKTSYVFTSLDENTRYYARITLTDIPNFPEFSNTFEVSTKDCGNTNPEDTNSTPTPTATPTSTPSPTSSTISLAAADPTSTPSPSPSTTNDQQSKTSQLTSPSPKSIFSGTLNDVFGTKPDSNSTQPGSEPSFFRKIILGWQAIFQTIFSL